MKLSAHLELVLLIPAAMFFVVSCAPSVIATPTSTRAPTISVTAAQTTTPSPEPTATPVASLSPEEIEIVNRRFQDFLNAEGDFTDDIITRTAFSFKNKKLDLGLVFIQNDSYAIIQGVLLFHTEVFIGQSLAIGIKDKKGERRIIVCEYPIKYYEDEGYSSFWVVQYDSKFLNENSIQVELKGREQLDEYLDLNIGRIGLLGTCIKQSDKQYSDESQNRIIRNFALKSEINYDLATSVFVPEGRLTNDECLELSKMQGSGLDNILDVESFYEAIAINSNLPALVGVDFTR